MEVLAGTEEYEQRGAQDEDGGDMEGVAEAEVGGHEAAEEESGHVAGEERTGVDAEGVALLLLRGGAGDEGHGGGDGSGENALECAEQNELGDILGEAHEAQHQRSAEGGSQGHVFATVTVSQPAPDGREDGESELGDECRQRGIETYLSGGGGRCQFAKKIRREGDRKRETTDGDELRHPKHPQISSPIGIFFHNSRIRNL